MGLISGLSNSLGEPRDLMRDNSLFLTYNPKDGLEVLNCMYVSESRVLGNKTKDDYSRGTEAEGSLLQRE